MAQRHIQLFRNGVPSFNALRDTHAKVVDFLIGADSPLTELNVKDGELVLYRYQLTQGGDIHTIVLAVSFPEGGNKTFEVVANYDHLTNLITDLNAELTVSNEDNDITVSVKQEAGLLTEVKLTDNLAEVAHTGAAADVTIADTAELFTATNVEAALAEVMTKANELDAAQLEAGKGIDIVGTTINADLKLSIANETTGEGESAVTTTYLYIKDTEGNEISKVDASDFVKDGFLQKVEKDATTNELIFTWNTDAEGAGKQNQVTRIAISDLCDVYTAKENDWIELNGFEFSHKTVANVMGTYANNADNITVNSTDEKTFIIPTITVDGAGHVTTVVDKTVKIALPDSIDNALQGVSATGDNYITAAFAEKDGDNKQALTVSANTGSVANGEDGLAIASDVKKYVDNQIANIDQDHSETTLDDVENGGIIVKGGLVEGSENDYAYTVELEKVNNVTDEDGNVVIAESNVNDSFADNTTNTIRVMSGVTVDAYGRVSGIQYKTIEESWDCGTYGETNN